MVSVSVRSSLCKVPEGRRRWRWRISDMVVMMVRWSREDVLAERVGRWRISAMVAMMVRWSEEDVLAKRVGRRARFVSAVCLMPSVASSWVTRWIHIECELVRCVSRRVAEYGRLSHVSGSMVATSTSMMMVWGVWWHRASMVAMMTTMMVKTVPVRGSSRSMLVMSGMTFWLGMEDPDPAEFGVGVRGG